MKLKALIAWAGVLALALSGSATAQVALEELIMASDEAMNVEDVDMAVSHYADGATYTVIRTSGAAGTGQGIRTRSTSYVDNT